LSIEKLNRVANAFQFRVGLSVGLPRIEFQSSIHVNERTGSAVLRNGFRGFSEEIDFDNGDLFFVLAFVIVGALSLDRDRRQRRLADRFTNWRLREDTKQGDAISGGFHLFFSFQLWFRFLADLDAPV